MGELREKARSAHPFFWKPEQWEKGFSVQNIATTTIIVIKQHDLVQTSVTALSIVHYFV